MARYIDADELSKLLEIDAVCQGDHFTKRDAIRCVKAINTADVAPKIDVAMDVFAKVRQAFYKVNSEVNNQLTKAQRENDHIKAERMLEVKSVMCAVRRIIAEYENEYIQGTTGHEIFYRGPHGGVRNLAQEDNYFMNAYGCESEWLHEK